ncbi:SAM-dependent methyltransferase [Undibacter mobilis]|uniref:Class I SAM-dependent methyltransferase n=1 Tax=Undibacter mobilis TaxID=2292256 RepID=A0A371B939_9BRAD|nr:class I SAM-dependent methyltransferase [Undibacter mobilis]RDV04027.1 class I SAM-dependent methyltransferase [Undibacter mobilis]
MSEKTDFDHWQERFAGDDYRFGTEPNAFLKAQAHLLRKGERALAIADGEGRNGVYLASQGLDVLSVDFSPNAQVKARKLAAARGVTMRVEQADIVNWDWPADAFDVVAAIFFQFAGPADRAKIFAGIKKALKPGGLLLLEGYGPKQLDYKTGGPSRLENLYTRDLLENAFADFASLDIREYDAEIHEGPGHAGLSALIDLVGRK